MAVSVVDPALKIGPSRPIHEDGARTLMAAPDHPTDTGQEPDQPAQPAGRPARVRALVVVTALVAAAVSALVFDPAVVTHAPVVFGLLVVSFVVLDVVRIDLFERAHISP